MKKYVMAALAALSISPALFAQQDLISAYFLDGYVNNHQFNPSFAPARGYISLPVVGHTQLELSTNLGLEDFVRQQADGSLVTILSSTISASDALSGFKKINTLNIGSNINLFGLGFWTGKAYHTLGVDLRVSGGLTIPGDFIRFVKEGSAGSDTFTFSRIGARAQAFGELYYGYSRTVIPGMRVGAKFKLLAGLANIEGIYNQLEMKAGAEEWNISGRGTITTSLPEGFYFQTKGETNPDCLPEDRNVMDFASFKMPETIEPLEMLKSFKSFGGAIDLGISYEFLNYFVASAAILDLGMISWSNCSVAKTPENSWSFTGFEDLSLDDESSNNIENQLDGFKEQLMEFARFEMDERGQKKMSMIPMTANLGLEVKMPFWKSMSVGVLETMRFDEFYLNHEFRSYLNLELGRFLGLSGSYAMGNCGKSVGAVANFQFPGISLFVGMDNIMPLTHMTKEFIPIGKLGNTRVQFGLNITFGKHHRNVNGAVKKERGRVEDVDILVIGDNAQQNVEATSEQAVKKGRKKSEETALEDSVETVKEEIAETATEVITETSTDEDSVTEPEE